MTRDRKLLLVLVGVAILVRVGAAVVVGSEFQYADELSYADAAHRLLAGDGFAATYNRVPAYPAFLAPLLAVAPGPIVVLRIAQGVIAALASCLTYGVCKRLFGLRAAVAAGLIVAVDPLLGVSSALLYPEAITSVVVLLMVWSCLDAAREDRLWRSAATGALLGVAIELRQIAVFFAPVVVLWMVVRAQPPRWRRAGLHSIVLAACAGLVLLPWSLRNYRVRGTLNPIAMAGTSGTPVDAGVRSGQGVAAAYLERALDDTGSVLRGVTRRFFQFWELYPTRIQSDDPDVRARARARDRRFALHSSFPVSLRDCVSAISFGAELVLAMAGIVFAFRRRPAETKLLLATILVFAFGYSLFVSKMRYRIPILPLLMIFSGVGAAGLYGLWRPEKPSSGRDELVSEPSGGE